MQVGRYACAFGSVYWAESFCKTTLRYVAFPPVSDTVSDRRFNLDISIYHIQFWVTVSEENLNRKRRILVAGSRLKLNDRELIYVSACKIFKIVKLGAYVIIVYTIHIWSM